MSVALTSLVTVAGNTYSAKAQPATPNASAGPRIFCMISENGVSSGPEPGSTSALASTFQLDSRITTEINMPMPAARKTISQ